MINHNIENPLPKSWDGTPAQKCNRDGSLNPEGGYITWEVKANPGDTFTVTRIAKLSEPEEITEPYSLPKMRQAIKHDIKYNGDVIASRNRMRAKLVNIYGRLGISYIDALNITHVTPEVDTGAWGTGEKETDEFILINPYILLFKRTWASFLIQHEVMHRALYRGRQNLTDQVLVNVVLDICINRILAATHNGKLSKNWNAFCRWIYPKSSKESVLALCNSSLTERELKKLNKINPMYAEIWEDLYGKEQGHMIVGTTKKGLPKKKKITGMLSFKFKDLSPDDLYFRLKSQITENDRKVIKALEEGLNPFGQSAEITLKNGKKVGIRKNLSDIASPVSKKLESALRKSLVPKRLRNINWSNYKDTRTEFWDQFVKTPSDLFDDDLEKYARRIYTEKIMDNIVGRITEAHKNEVVNQVYPGLLSEDGTLLAILGFKPPHFPFFQNIHGPHGRKRCIVFYDVSPSTAPFWPYMHYMSRCFEDVMDISFARNSEGESGSLSFCGNVKALSEKEIDEMKKGNLQWGYGTSFNAVIEYCLEKTSIEDVDTIIIFTDGDGNDENFNFINARKFNRSGRQMYRIYTIEDSKANKGVKITSDLDKLNGESYTLHLPKSDNIFGF